MTHDKHKNLLEHIRSSGELQSLLYDLDLMPEQLREDTRDWVRMLTLAEWHKARQEGKP